MRPYLSEILLDQIPSLIELQRYLDQLAIMDPPSVKRDLILEQVFSIYPSLFIQSNLPTSVTPLYVSSFNEIVVTNHNMVQYNEKV